MLLWFLVIQIVAFVQFQQKNDIFQFSIWKQVTVVLINAFQKKQTVKLLIIFQISILLIVI